jgi:hypothetical protein
MRFLHLSLLTTLFSACLPIGDDSGRPALNWEISYEPLFIENSSRIVSIQNLGPESASFILKWNGIDSFSLAGLLNQIASYDPEESKAYLQAWKFVRDHSQHYAPLSPLEWFHHPVLFFNSAGFGICDDQAEALYHLWTAMGYEARLWGLSGHVVPEVFADGKWQLLDPDFGTYYLNDSGEIASIEEISRDPTLIYNPRSMLEDYLPGAYSEGVAALYASTDDNRFCSSTVDLGPQCAGPASFKNGDFFTLPGQSTLELPHEAPDYLTFDPDVAQIPEFKIAILKIAPGVSGRVNVPLIPVKATGTGNVRTTRGTIEVGENLNQYFAERMRYSPTFWVDSGAGGMEIHFSLNPQHFHTRDFAGLILQSDRPDLLNVSDNLGSLMMTSVEFVVD